MKRSSEKQNQILLTLSNEIVRIRGKEDMLQLIQNSLKLYLAFNDSFIMRYNKQTKTCRSYIYHADEIRAGNNDFNQLLYEEFLVEDESITDNNLPIIQDVEVMASAGNKQVSFIHRNGIKEFVSVKLIEGNALIGFLVLLSEKRKSFNDQDIELLKSISYPISIATANIIANEQLQEREKEKTILLDFSRDIAALRSREDLFNIVNKRIKELFAVTEFGIAQINEDGETYSAFMLDFKEEIKSNEDFVKVTSEKYSITDPIFTRIMQQIEPEIFDVNEVAKQPGMPAYVTYWKQAGFRYYLTIPLNVGGRLIGFLNLHFEKKELIRPQSALLKGICDQLAVAVSNIIYKEKVEAREREKNLLISLSNEIASLKNRQDLFTVVNGKIKQLFGIKELGFSKIDDGGKTYSIFLVDVGERVRSHPEFGNILTAQFDVHDPLFSAVIKLQEPVQFDVQELAKLPDMPPYVNFWIETGIENIVTAPLNTGGNCIGTALFIVEKDVPFNTKSALLKGVCSQLAVTVSNILSNERIQAREAEKARLLEFSNAMASVRDKQVLAKILKNQLLSLFGIGDYVIHVLSKDKKTHRPVLFDPQADFAKHGDFQKLLHLDSDVNDGVFNVILNSQDIVFFNVEDWFTSSTPPTYSDAAKSIGLKKMGGIAIRLGEENIAVMNFRTDGINSEIIQQPIFKSICSQIAISISGLVADDEINGRELEKTMLLNFSNSIAAITEKSNYSKILRRHLKELFGIEDYAIHELSEDKKMYRPLLYDPDARFAIHPAFIKSKDNFIDLREAGFDTILLSEEPIELDMEQDYNSADPSTFAKVNRDIGLQKIIGMRLRLGNENIGMLHFLPTASQQFQSKKQLFKSICSQLAIAVFNFIANEKINRQLSEIEKYKQQLEEEKIYLKEEIEINQNYAEIIGDSQEIKTVFRKVTQVAHSDSSVLLLGETGTGKELIARAIHNTSPRKHKLMIKINCAALPANLIESELFGHERGSFTGAVDRRIGKFELANNSTLFLDEIGEMPLELQVKLLRALQEKEIERVGGRTTIKTDVRIIAATNRDLEKMMDEGTFRSDLYYRLNIFPIQLPALRQRKEDIPKLATHFISRYSKKAGKNIKTFSNRAMQQLQNYHWPGNIRELEHLIERTVLLTDGDSIREVDLPLPKIKTSLAAETQAFKVQTIFENEKEYILKMLEYTDGKISGEGGAAALSGIPPSTLNSRIKKLGIRRQHRAD